MVRSIDMHAYMSVTLLSFLAVPLCKHCSVVCPWPTTG